MKFRKDRDILIFLGISIVMILSGFVLSKFIDPPPIGLSLAGLIIFISSLYISTKSKTDVLIDERIIRINEKAGYHTYWIIMSFVTLLWNKINVALGILLLTITLLGLFKKPFYLKTTIISFMLGSYVLLSAYLRRKRITAELEGETIADERSKRAFERAGFFSFFLLIGYYIDKKGEG